MVKPRSDGVADSKSDIENEVDPGNAFEVSDNDEVDGGEWSKVAGRQRPPRSVFDSFRLRRQGKKKKVSTVAPRMTEMNFPNPAPLKQRGSNESQPSARANCETGNELLATSSNAWATMASDAIDDIGTLAAALHHLLHSNGGRVSTTDLKLMHLVYHRLSPDMQNLIGKEGGLSRWIIKEKPPGLHATNDYITLLPKVAPQNPATMLKLLPVNAPPPPVLSMSSSCVDSSLAKKSSVSSFHSSSIHSLPTAMRASHEYLTPLPRSAAQTPIHWLIPNVPVGRTNVDAVASQIIKENILPPVGSQMVGLSTVKKSPQDRLDGGQKPSFASSEKAAAAAGSMVVATGGVADSRGDWCGISWSEDQLTLIADYFSGGTEAELFENSVGHEYCRLADQLQTLLKDIEDYDDY